MNLIESLSRILGRVPAWVFTVIGSIGLIALLGWIVHRQLRRMRQGTQISERLREAQEAYNTAIHFRNAGDKEKALECMQQSLLIYEEIGVNGEERAIIEQAIRELKAQDAPSSEEKT